MAMERALGTSAAQTSMVNPSGSLSLSSWTSAFASAMEIFCPSGPLVAAAFSSLQADRLSRKTAKRVGEKRSREVMSLYFG